MRDGMIFGLLVAVGVTLLAVELGRAARGFSCRAPDFGGVVVDLSLGLAAVAALVSWVWVLTGVFFT